MKKIVLGITSLSLGGAERVLVDLVNRLADEYEITIFMLYAKGELIGQLKPEIKVETVYSFSYQEASKWQRKIVLPLKVLFGKKQIYRNYIKDKYDVEISFLEGPISRIFATKNREVKKIAWIHNDISRVFGKGIKSRLKKWMDKKIYEKYDTLVFVSKDNKEKFAGVYKEIRNELLQPIPQRVVYNYIEKQTILEKAEEKPEVVFDSKKKTFLTVARLVEQKGLDRWIRIHSNLVKNGYLHQVYVIGEGPLKEQLQKKIREEKVENTFILLGKKENPYPYIKMADYFCLLSYFEGYGMVLEEAKILQKPIIITDTAAREAVLRYPNSKILPNEQGQIEEGLKAITQQKEIGFEVTEKQDYENEKIIEKVKKVIEEPKLSRKAQPKEKKQ